MQIAEGPLSSAVVICLFKNANAIADEHLLLNPN